MSSPRLRNLGSGAWDVLIAGREVGWVMRLLDQSWRAFRQVDRRNTALGDYPTRKAAVEAIAQADAAALDANELDE